MKSKNLSVLRRLFGYLRPYLPGYILGGSLVALSQSAMILVSIFFSKMLIDTIVSGDTAGLLRMLILCAEEP